MPPISPIAEVEAEEVLSPKQHLQKQKSVRSSQRVAPSSETKQPVDASKIERLAASTPKRGVEILPTVDIGPTELSEQRRRAFTEENAQGAGAVTSSDFSRAPAEDQTKQGSAAKKDVAGSKKGKAKKKRKVKPEKS